LIEQRLLRRPASAFQDEVGQGLVSHFRRPAQDSFLFRRSA